MLPRTQIRSVSRVGSTLLALSFLPLALFGCPEMGSEYGFPGPYKASYYDLQLDDGSEVSVFYTEDTQCGEGCPLIIFSVGWNQIRRAYFDYADQLAQWGYVCAIRYYPSLGNAGIGNDLLDYHVVQVSDVIDRCLVENTDPTSPLYGRIDGERIGAAGHSMGGVVTVFSALNDERIRAVVTLDGGYVDTSNEMYTISGFENVTAPMLFVEAGAAGYCSVNPYSLYRFYDIVNPPSMLAIIEGAGHMDFMEDDCDLLCQLGRYTICSAGTADPEEVRAIATRYMVSWFNYYLRHEEDFETYFNGPSSQGDVDAGLVTIERKLLP